ncbi:MAG TPA: hypothetical protein PLP17_17425, partial [Oligoflexia bacterium]|nr:hypothetical protein [Oligoflexia bacterium]
MSNKPVEPTLLHPSQFLRLVRMSSEELLRLLEQGKLPFLKAPTGELLIDLNSVTPEILARKRQRQDSLLTKNEQN